MQHLKCGLCSTENRIPYMELDQKIDGKLSSHIYFRCLRCDLISKSPSNYLSRGEELKRYLTHKNDLQQEGYRNHLNRLWGPLKTYIFNGATGLDYGSGPTPSFAELMLGEGYKVSIWDPFFASNKKVLDKTYDFVTCMEVIEHCVNPHLEISRMLSLLKTGGVLAIGTWQLTDDISFENWSYRLDPTHISFFTPKSFEWCRAYWELVTLYSTEKVVIFKKK